MTVGYNNIFPISDAEQFICTVIYFGGERSELKIKVYNDKDIEFYLTFRVVRYFSGPFEWKSANFVLAHTEVFKNLMLSLHYPETICDMIIEKEWSYLYFIDKLTYNISIVAASVQKSYYN